MLKLGIVYKDDGRWHGKAILSSQYAHEALSALSQVDDSGYGYFWWRPWRNVAMPNGPERVYIGAAQGNGGQKIFVLPEYDFVAVLPLGFITRVARLPTRL